jgi:Ran GTPase-activating protein (RanGAP) involved in mRNA processing and transport
MSLSWSDDVYKNEEEWKRLLDANINTELTELHITNCEISIENLKLLLQKLIQVDAQLSILDLSGNNISNEIAIPLSEYLVKDHSVC